MEVARKIENSKSSLKDASEQCFSCRSDGNIVKKMYEAFIKCERSCGMKIEALNDFIDKRITALFSFCKQTFEGKSPNTPRQTSFFNKTSLIENISKYRLVIAIGLIVLVGLLYGTIQINQYASRLSDGSLKLALLKKQFSDEVINNGTLAQQNVILTKNNTDLTQRNAALTKNNADITQQNAVLIKNNTDITQQNAALTNLTQQQKNSLINPKEIINISKLLHIDGQSSAINVREKLINYIWKGQNSINIKKLPLIEDAKTTGLKGEKRESKLTFKMAYGVDSTGVLIESQFGNGTVAIYCNGHDSKLAQDATNLIETLLQKGVDVIICNMPFTNGTMPSSMVNGSLHVNGQLISASNAHNDLSKLEDSSFSPISYFVDPIIMTLNFVNKTDRYKKIGVIGFGENALFATLVGAIDQRVSSVYSICGAAPPIKLKTDSDWEQNHELLKEHWYDLIVLSAFGEGRNITYLCNECDPKLPGSFAYWVFPQLSCIASRMQGVGNISFQVEEDAAAAHTITNRTISKVVDDFLGM